MNTFFKPKLLLEVTTRPTKPESHILSLEPISSYPILSINDEVQISHDNTIEALNWTEQINELETYFTTRSLPETPLILSRPETIQNLPFFINAHLTYIKANNGNPTFSPYLNRLQQLKQILIQHTNGKP